MSIFLKRDEKLTKPWDIREIKIEEAGSVQRHGEVLISTELLEEMARYKAFDAWRNKEGETLAVFNTDSKDCGILKNAIEGFKKEAAGFRVSELTQTLQSLLCFISFAIEKLSWGSPRVT